MIVTDCQQRMQDWLCTRLERSCSPNMRCIGNMSNGKLIGVIGLDDWDSASVQMHAAGYGNWITRDFLWVVSDYIFNVAKVNVVYGLIPSNNARSLKIAQHFGFVSVYNIKDGHAEGDLILHLLYRDGCKYLNRMVRHGQESRDTCSA